MGKILEVDQMTFLNILCGKLECLDTWHVFSFANILNRKATSRMSTRVNCCAFFNGRIDVEFTSVIYRYWPLISYVVHAISGFINSPSSVHFISNLTLRQILPSGSPKERLDKKEK